MRSINNVGCCHNINTGNTDTGKCERAADTASDGSGAGYINVGFRQRGKGNLVS